MSWDPSKSGLTRLALVALLVTGAASAAANVLVVRSSGPSAKGYPPGKSLPDNARIALRNGDTVVVLSGSGTRTFRGPGNFSPSAAVVAGNQTDPQGRRVRIGAVRSAAFLPTSPATIWQVDVSQGGTVCVPNARDVTLWRSDSSAASSLAISGPGGASRQVAWPAGASTLTWPSDLAIADGAEYQLRQPNVAVPTSVRFKSLNSQPADLAGVAEVLIQNGCQEQLDLLVDTAPTQ